MRKVAIFLVSVLTSGHALAECRFFVPITVKVMSSFRRGFDTGLEGSGVFFQMNSRHYVLTSAHVVLPAKTTRDTYMSSPEDFNHLIQTSERGPGRQNLFRAELRSVDWEHGLALLKLGDSNYWNFDELGKKNPLFEMKDLMRPEWMWDCLRENLSGFGYPAGGDIWREINGTLGEMIPAGQVLLKQRVQVARGMSAEFGMSGGPVFGPEGFMGILSHTTFDGTDRTFVIPADDIRAWLSGELKDGAEVFYPSADDIEKQYLSRSGVETIRMINPFTSDVVKIEKHGDRLRFFNDPAADRMGRSAVSLSAYPALRQVFREVSQKLELERGSTEPHAFDVFALKGQNGEELKLDRELSLVQALHAFTTTAARARYQLVRTDPYWSDGFPIATFDSLSVVSTDYRVTTGSKKKKSPPKVETVRVEIENQRNPEDWSSKLVFFETRSSDGKLGPRKPVKGPEGGMTGKQWRAILRECDKSGGQVEVIEVPAGPYETCRKTVQGVTTWWGAVPFYGFVKKQNQLTTWELEKVTFK